MAGLVEGWFGESFQRLDPLIQRLHQYDHTLNGAIQIEYTKGFAGEIGKTIGHKFGIPKVSGTSLLTVDISHTDEYLLWSRKFGDSGKRMDSKFYPVGNFPHGGWRESTNGVDVTLCVEIKNGAWHWKQKSIKIHGISTPLFTSPKIVAYKEVVNGQYKFCVEFLLPGLGSLFKYNGLLKAL